MFKQFGEDYMLIEKIEEKILDELKEYKKVDICNIEGLEYPVILRHNTLDTFVAHEIFQHKFYDVSMQNSRMYSDYIEEYGVRKPRYILDAGGNIGLAAIFFAVNYPDAQILTIEPDKDNYFILINSFVPLASFCLLYFSRDNLHGFRIS
jgi:hypothetical protein